jgi:pyridoxal 5'-phosphate synthase pdxS subunit
MWQYDEQMKLKVGLAEMLKGGVIMDVTTAEQAKIAENAGAAAVMALERVPADIRKEGGVARMASIKIIKEIMTAVSIPVMAKARIGHFAEAQVLEAVGVDYVDESEVLTPADEEHHINKWPYKVPFVCGARNLGEALRRIGEGAAMIRTKGEAGSGNIVEAVRHLRAITGEIRQLTLRREEELMAHAKELGAEAVFVGSGIFKSSDPERRAKAIVRATTHYTEPQVVAQCSEELGEAMRGIDVAKLKPEELLQTRGW